MNNRQISITILELYALVAVIFASSTVIFDIVIYHTTFMTSLIHAGLFTMLSVALTAIYHLKIRK